MTTLTARSPEDLLALVPVVLGFTPADSAVMLTFGGPHPFHARVDLPPPGAPPGATAALVESLLAPAARHRVERVAFLLYSGDPAASAVVSDRLVRAFGEAGIGVVDAVRADGRCWHPLLRIRGPRPAAGVPYDVSTHPFAAQAVLDGRVTHGSRDDLAATLDPDPPGVAAVAARCRAVVPPTSPEWVEATAGRLAGAGARADDAVAARLLTAVTADVTARDAAWVGVSRDEARAHLDLWSDLVRRAPDEIRAAACAVVAVLAWICGEGALAWCGIDRAQALDPQVSLAGFVAELLTGAVPPSSWDLVRVRADLA